MGVASLDERRRIADSRGSQKMERDHVGGDTGSWSYVDFYPGHRTEEFDMTLKRFVVAIVAFGSLAAETAVFYQGQSVHPLCLEKRTVVEFGFSKCHRLILLGIVYIWPVPKVVPKF